MDQISLPFRIALVAILAVGALYLVVLRPTGGDQAAAPLPPATTTTATTSTSSSGPSAPGLNGLTSAVSKAHGASAAQDGSNAATETAAAAAAETSTTTTPGGPVAITPGTSTGTAGATSTTTPATATTAAAAKPTVEPPTDPSVPLLAELDRGRTVVLLFAGSTAADDRAVRRALARIDRRGGKVAVHVAPLRRVGAYEAITRGVQVQQSPTLLVIGRQHTARTIVGFTTTSEIDQLVADVRRARG